VHFNDLPRQRNIVSEVDFWYRRPLGKLMQLWKENKLKFPVVVDKHTDKNEVKTLFEHLIRINVKNSTLRLLYADIPATLTAN
jgi:hypothetical protein